MAKGLAFGEQIVDFDGCEILHGGASRFRCSAPVVSESPGQVRVSGVLFQSWGFITF